MTWDRWLMRKDLVMQQADIGEADWPRILLWDVREQMSVQVLSDAIQDVWTHVNDCLVALPIEKLPKYDGRTPDRLTPAEWMELFDRVGYLSYEGESQAACETPTVLFRYAEHDGEISWAWTVGLEEAANFEFHFADRVRPACIWQVSDVDPDRVLAHFHSTPQEGDVSEDEYVYIPAGSEILHVRAGTNCPDREATPLSK